MVTLRGSGVFRDNEDWVRVRYSDGREIDMTKASYVASRRSPPFEALPLAPSADRPLAALEKRAQSAAKPNIPRR